MIHSFRATCSTVPALFATALFVVAPPGNAQGNAKDTDGAQAPPSGAPSDGPPYSAPKGFPADLAFVPQGTTWVGLSPKDFEDLMKEIAPSKQQEGLHKRFVKGLVRELGRDNVLVPAFYIGTNEVTNAQYAKFVAATGHRPPLHWWDEADKAAHTQKYREANPKSEFVPIEYWIAKWPELKMAAPEAIAQQPVVYVSLDDARAFCIWAGVRLPTEAEYHRAALGEKERRYTFADKWDNKLLERLKLHSGRYRHLKDVGALGPDMRSAFGMNDMEGNVAEWVDKPFVEMTGKRQFERDFKAIPRAYQSKDFMPEWDESEGLVKGSAYMRYTPDQAAETFRVNFRQNVPTHKPFELVGFRVAKSTMPGKDAFAFRLSGAKAQYEHDVLGGLKVAVDEARGIEKWVLDEKGLITGYHTVAFAPIAQFKDLDSIKSFDDKAKDAPVPVALVLSTEPLAEPELEPGIHTVFYRGKGMPKDLEVALKAAEVEIKAGKRISDQPDDEKESKAKAKGKEKASGSPGAEQAKADWRPVLKAYGITEEQVKKKKVDHILIQPGNILVPLGKSVFLFRKNKGAFVAMIDAEEVETDGATSDLESRDDKDRLVFTSRTPGRVQERRFRFKIPVRMQPGKLSGGSWLRPLADMEAALDPVNGKPTKQVHPPAKGK